MKLSNSFFYTLREDVKDEDSISGNLLVRAGFIKKTAAGIYMFMPLGLKVLNKIEGIIREEMNAINSLEMRMPSLITEDVYVKSGRRETIGESMFQLEDRYERPFVLGPTHEELFAQAAKMMVQSYKDLPISLYQFQNKFRDEARPRFGLIRVREFVMKDAYSFDKNQEGLDHSYQNMYQAYKNIFDRLELEYHIVKADTGIMGGQLSEEFQAISSIGEDTIVLSEDGSYASNLEVAENAARIVSEENFKTIEKIETPNQKTIDEISSFLNIDKDKIVKTLIYKVDDKFVACCVLGDRDVNETKLAQHYQAQTVELASDNDIYEITQAPVGFSGPLGLKIEVIVDKHIQGLRNFVIGANQKDMHYINANFKDFKVTEFFDISNVKEGDPNPEGEGKLHFVKSIEVGNTFKLGTSYSTAMELAYLDDHNNSQDVYMGSYGIGLARTMAAIVEQKHDEYGIVWPLNIAPFQVSIIVINSKDEEQQAFALDLYHRLKNEGIEVILDDRHTRPGVKFNDMDLIGIPYRITVGRDLKDGFVEFKTRSQKDFDKLAIEEIINHIKSKINKKGL